eukprot:Skav201538  [mRNA]  locus=scaffold1616:112838:114854:+ [translate_table: standard]
MPKAPVVVAGAALALMGRKVAMTAFENELGVQAPVGFWDPVGLKFADVPNGLSAISKVPVAGWAQIAAYFGFVEFSGGFDDYKSGTPGDYGFKVLTSSDPEEKSKKLSAELANGRLAMMAIIGMFFQEAAREILKEVLFNSLGYSIVHLFCCFQAVWRLQYGLNV